MDGPPAGKTEATKKKKKAPKIRAPRMRPPTPVEEAHVAELEARPKPFSPSVILLVRRLHELADAALCVWGYYLRDLAKLEAKSRGWVQRAIATLEQAGVLASETLTATDVYPDGRRATQNALLVQLRPGASLARAISEVEIPRVEIPRVEIPRVEIPRVEIPRVEIHTPPPVNVAKPLTDSEAPWSEGDPNVAAAGPFKFKASSFSVTSSDLEPTLKASAAVSTETPESESESYEGGGSTAEPPAEPAGATPTEAPESESDEGGTSEPLVPPMTREERNAARYLLAIYAAGPDKTGDKRRPFAPKTHELVTRCLRDMDGPLEARKARLEAVIHDAHADSVRRGYKRPTLLYVFALEHVRRRLHRLAEADAKVPEADDAPIVEGLRKAVEAFGRATSEAEREAARAQVANFLRFATGADRKLIERANLIASGEPVSPPASGVRTRAAATDDAPRPHEHPVDADDARPSRMPAADVSRPLTGRAEPASGFRIRAARPAAEGDLVAPYTMNETLRQLFGGVP